MYSANTGYGGGGVTTSYAGSSSAGGPFSDPFFQDLIKRQAQLGVAAQARAQRPRAAAPTRQAVIRRPTERMAGQRQAVGDWSGGGDKVATYVKPATMFNSMGGYMRASAGDPGAVHAGYVDPRSLPQAAGLSAVGGADDTARAARGAIDFARFANESATRQAIDAGGGLPAQRRPANPMGYDDYGYEE